MTPRLVRKLAGLAPPALRRGVAGALIDLSSLPARLADSARRAEPWAFVHLRMPAVRRYLAESARVLKPGGRLAFTCFALEPGRERSAMFDFQPFDATSAVIDRRTPERAIGHRREALEAALAEAGLTP